MAKKNQSGAAEDQLMGAQEQNSQAQNGQTQENPAQEIAAVRVLSNFSVGGVDYRPNDLVEFHASVLATISPNVYDVSREAVEYCVEQGYACKRHPIE